MPGTPELLEVRDGASTPFGELRRSRHRRNTRLLQLHAERPQIEQLRRRELDLVRRADDDHRPAHRASPAGIDPSGATSAITSREGARIRCAAASTSLALTAAICSAYRVEASAPSP